MTESRTPGEFFKIERRCVVRINKNDRHGAFSKNSSLCCRCSIILFSGVAFPKAVLTITFSRARFLMWTISFDAYASATCGGQHRTANEWLSKLFLPTLLSCEASESFSPLLAVLCFDTRVCGGVRLASVCCCRRQRLCVERPPHMSIAECDCASTISLAVWLNLLLSVKYQIDYPFLSFPGERHLSDDARLRCPSPQILRKPEQTQKMGKRSMISRANPDDHVHNLYIHVEGHGQRKGVANISVECMLRRRVKTKQAGWSTSVPTSRKGQDRKKKALLVRSV